MPDGADRTPSSGVTGRFSRVDRVARTGSTNADLVAAARAGAGECALVADVQDAGRGRLGRRWEAPPGASLLMSVLVRPPLPATGANLLGTAMGLCAAESLEELTGLDVGLKWPNDVVAPAAGHDGADLKLGGLLAELTHGPGDGPEDAAVVVGLGLNLAWAEHGFPDEIAATATAVDLLGASVDRSELVATLLERFAEAAELDHPVRCDRLVDRYRGRCVTLGRRVRVETPAGELLGDAVDVTAQGALVLRDDTATLHTVTVGDVVHLRAAG